jgi:DNA-binding transcriptional MerR regulator
VDEIVAVMRHAGDDRHGFRLRALIIVLWRGGLRIQEALALGERDLDPRRGSLLVRNGKGGRRREIGMDAWGWEQLHPWLAARLELPVGPLFCVIDGPTRGRPWSSANARVEFRRLAAQAGIRRRFAPHQLRHAHAVELAREGVPLNVIQRQLGHANLGNDQHLPARHRHRRDHRHRPRQARADDVRHRRPATLSNPKTASAGAPQPSRCPLSRPPPSRTNAIVSRTRPRLPPRPDVVRSEHLTPELGDARLRARKEERAAGLGDGRRRARVAWIAIGGFAQA